MDPEDAILVVAKTRHYQHSLVLMYPCTESCCLYLGDSRNSCCSKGECSGALGMSLDNVTFCRLAQKAA